MKKKAAKGTAKKPEKKIAKPKESLKDKWANKKLEDLGKKPEKTTKLAKAEILLSEPQAKELEAGIIADISAAEGSVVAAARKIDAFVRGEGWKALGFVGMTEWRDERMNFSLFYNARNAAKLLAAGVPAASVERMKLTNINTLTRKLPESKWTDQKILDLAAGPVKEFDAKVSKQSDEIGMNVEDLVSRGFRVSMSLAKNWDNAMRIAKLVDGCKDQESCVEALIAAYVNGNSETPGKTRMQLYSESYSEEGSEKKASWLETA